MSTRVLVTGATGTLGRKVSAAAVAAGHDVFALSRREQLDNDELRWRQADLLKGTRIDAAVDGMDVIVNCATQPIRDKDVASMQNLTSAVRRAGVGHLVHVSIVGIDRFLCPTTGPSFESSRCWRFPASAIRCCAPPSSTT